MIHLIAWGITAGRPSDGGCGSPLEQKRDHGKCQVALPWVGGWDTHNRTTWYSLRVRARRSAAAVGPSGLCP
jgi:hypothetical protein